LIPYITLSKDARLRITVYDSLTRSMLPNSANKSALTSNDKLKLNADGSKE
jgi:hypothetical protein